MIPIYISVPGIVRLQHLLITCGSAEILRIKAAADKLPKEQLLPETTYKNGIEIFCQLNIIKMEKYYTPQISEFNTQFDFEVLNTKNKYYWPDGIEGEWLKVGMSNGILSNIENIQRLLNDNQIRVKHTDKEDIESLRWKYDPSWKHYQTYFIGDTFKLSITFGKDDIISEILICKNIGNWNKTCYSGSIRNKSELRRIMKMIGI